MSPPINDSNQQQSPQNNNILEANEHNQQQSNDEQNTKTFEMNTYVQLDIDNNNSLCVSRTCKFRIKQLVIKRELIQQLLLQSSLISNQSQQHNSSQPSNLLIIAIKLHFNKRILRTIELPLNKLIQSQQLNEQNISINLNLFYNISYSHYLKKNTNFLYIYIQRRKKYKNRTILGYKSLAMAKIDLQSIMQRTYNVDLLLETVSNQGAQLLASSSLTSTASNSNSSSTNNNNKYSGSIMVKTNGLHDIIQLQQQYGTQICGYLTINSLGSHAFDYQASSDQEQQNDSTNNRKNLQLCLQQQVDDINDVIDDDDDLPLPQPVATSTNTGQSSILTNVIALKNKAFNNLTNRSTNSDSDIEVDPLTSSLSTANKLKIKRSSKTTTSNSANSNNNKKFTGKLISFIRKLRINDDINSSSSPNRNITSPHEVAKKASKKSENKRVINEDDEEIVSDFSDYNNNNSIGSASDIEADLYSIISTPKPSLQPFFKPIKNNDSEDDQQLDYQLTVDSNSDCEQQMDLSPKVATTTINSEFIMRNLDNLLLSLNSSTTTPIEITYYLIFDSNSFYSKLKEAQLNNSYLLNSNDLQRDLKLLFETLISWFNKNKQKLLILNNKKYQQQYYYHNSSQQPQQQQPQLIQMKIVLFGNDQFLNQFLRIYVETFKTQDLLNLFKFYFIPYYSSQSTMLPPQTNSQNLAKLLNQLDSNYQALFGDDYWLQLDSNLQLYDPKDMLQRIQRFVRSSSQTYVQLQICEVMINYIDENVIQQQLFSNESEDSNVQPFNIPFILDVKIGGTTSNTSSSFTNEQFNEFEQVLSGSPSHNKEDRPNVEDEIR